MNRAPQDRLAGGGKCDDSAGKSLPVANFSFYTSARCVRTFGISDKSEVISYNLSLRTYYLFRKTKILVNKSLKPEFEHQKSP